MDSIHSGYALRVGFELRLLRRLCASNTPVLTRALLARANAGDATSQILVGDSYKTGKVVEKDYTQAAAWYRKAAD